VERSRLEEEEVRGEGVGLERRVFPCRRARLRRRQAGIGATSPGSGRSRRPRRRGRVRRGRREGFDRGRRGHRFRDREIPNGNPDGGGIVLVGPSRDEGPEGRIGCEDPVVAVSVNPGRGENGGETVQKLQGREPEGSASGQVGPRQNVEHLVGTPTDEVEATQGGIPRRRTWRRTLFRTVCWRRSRRWGVRAVGAWKRRSLDRVSGWG